MKVKSLKAMVIGMILRNRKKVPIGVPQKQHQLIMIALPALKHSTLYRRTSIFIDHEGLCKSM